MLKKENEKYFVLEKFTHHRNPMYHEKEYEKIFCELFG